MRRVISINIVDVAKKMVYNNHTKEKIDANDFDGWTNDLVDILEDLYKLETEVQATITGGLV